MPKKTVWRSLGLAGVLMAVGCSSAPPPAAKASTPTAATTTSLAAATASRETHYPRIAKVEKVAAVKEVRAPAGQELWVVYFETPLALPADKDLAQTFLVDAKGRKRRSMAMLRTVLQRPAKDPGFVTLEFQLVGLAWTLPKGTTPQFFQFAQEAPVKLPL